MVDKKVVIIVSIIAIIITSIVVYFSLQSFDKQYAENENIDENVNKNYTNEQNENISSNNNKQKNELNQQNNIEKENETENENAIEEPANETKEDKDETPKVEEKNSGDEIAIELVKKEWGEKDDTVYYNIEEQISDNVYIVSVRDQETTEDLSEYRVDIKQKKVKKE